jgi:hypothetical protein
MYFENEEGKCVGGHIHVLMFRFPLYYFLYQNKCCKFLYLEGEALEAIACDIFHMLTRFFFYQTITISYKF